jgi:hypothetical protein
MAAAPSTRLGRSGLRADRPAGVARSGPGRVCPLSSFVISSNIWGSCQADPWAALVPNERKQKLRLAPKSGARVCQPPARRASAYIKFYLKLVSWGAGLQSPCTSGELLSLTLQTRSGQDRTKGARTPFIDVSHPIVGLLPAHHTTSRLAARGGAVGPAPQATAPPGGTATKGFPDTYR